MKTPRQSRSEADWWRLWPDLLESELAAFERHGASVAIKFQRNGVLIAAVEWPMASGEFVHLDVGYSPMHPFSRPTVTAPGLELARHQNPFTRALCLLTQESAQWHPRTKVADHIAEQLAQIFRVIRLRDEGNWEEAAKVEEAAPDPLSTYFQHLAEDGSIVLFDGAQRVPNAGYGIARFITQKRPFEGDMFEAVLRTVEPIKGPWLVKPFQLPKAFGSWGEVAGRWIRMRPPISDDPEAILAAVERELDRHTALLPAERAKMASISDAAFTITAILFEEELGYGPARSGDGWLFLATRRPNGSSRRRKVSLIRGQRLTDDMTSRLPVASALQAKTALVVGLGAIGSFAAIELARAGIGKLVIGDFDVVEPGNGVRWPLGRQAWGLRKTVALRDFLFRNYPNTDVIPLNAHFGAATTDPSEVMRANVNPLSQLRDFIRDADIVVDASASTECQHALAFNCRDLGKPYVVGYATEGAIGGVVARFSPEAAACFVCLQEHWHDGSLPFPPADPMSTVLPIGCNAPTFIGGAFDLQEVSLELARSAVGILAPGEYDAGEWALSVLTLAEGDRRVLPNWRGEAIGAHPRCHGAPQA